MQTNSAVEQNKNTLCRTCLLYSWILSLCVVILYGVTVNGYQLKPIDLPKDVENMRIFTDVELAQYDGSDVC